MERAMKTIERPTRSQPATMSPAGRLIAVCVSPGGIPKQVVSRAHVTAKGLSGDGHAHDKHNRPDRAVSLFDWEILTQLQIEGFPLYPGAIGENLTVAGLHVQRMPPGTLLEIGDVLLRLEQPRKPCYVLDAIDPCLKDVIVGRCGYMASVAREGIIDPSMPLRALINGSPVVSAGSLASGASIPRRDW
jgi:MOSC domain-containing protein YiiM